MPWKYLRGLLGDSEVPYGCLRGTLEAPGALRGASKVPQRCLREALEVSQSCLLGALEMPQKCLRGAAKGLLGAASQLM